MSLNVKETILGIPSQNDLIWTILWLLTIIVSNKNIYVSIVCGGACKVFISLLPIWRSALYCVSFYQPHTMRCVGRQIFVLGHSHAVVKIIYPCWWKVHAVNAPNYLSSSLPQWSRDLISLAKLDNISLIVLYSMLIYYSLQIHVSIQNTMKAALAYIKIHVGFWNIIFSRNVWLLPTEFITCLVIILLYKDFIKQLAYKT